MHDDGQERGVLNFVNIPYRNKPPYDFDTPPPSPLINKPTKYYISIHCYNTHYCLFTDHIYTHKHCINRNMLKHPRKGKIAQPCNFALTGETGRGGAGKNYNNRQNKKQITSKQRLENRSLRC